MVITLDHTDNTACQYGNDHYNSKKLHVILVKVLVHSRNSLISLDNLSYARSGTRTHTPKVTDFESVASANSATRAAELSRRYERNATVFVLDQ